MRILLVKRGAIGDILMTTPLIRQLRLNYPDAEIDYCLSNSCVATLKLNPHLTHLIALSDYKFSSRGIFSLAGFIFKIGKKYDYIFILGKSWLINLLFKLTNAKLIGFARENISKLLLDKYVVYDSVKRYQAFYYLDLLQASGLAKEVNYADSQLELVVDNDERNRVFRLLIAEAKFKNFVVVTNSGGNNQFDSASGIRMVPEDKILEILRKLLQQHTVILLGSEVDAQNYAGYCAKLLNPPHLVNFAGKLTIGESVYLLSVARHFYVTDCGAMHLGLAAGIARHMTCLFGPTDPAHILPPDSQCKILWSDQDLFNSDYQLYGKISNKEFFTKLDIDEVV